MILQALRPLAETAWGSKLEKRVLQPGVSMHGASPSMA